MSNTLLYFEKYDRSDSEKNSKDLEMCEFLSKHKDPKKCDGNKINNSKNNDCFWELFVSEGISPKSCSDRINDQSNNEHPGIVFVSPFFEKHITDDLEDNGNGGEYIEKNFWRQRYKSLVIIKSSFFGHNFCIASSDRASRGTRSFPSRRFGGILSIFVHSVRSASRACYVYLDILRGKRYPRLRWR